jgi:phage terminase large subunit
MSDAFRPGQWNKTESIYDFRNGARIEFFSADQSAKLRGGRRDILFINECNNVSKEAFDELDVRTRKCTFVDFNPVSEFYIHELQKLPTTEWIHSTFLDAQSVLDKSVVDNILSRKDRDPNWWRVYGLGLLGQLEGLIHPQFTQCNSLPEKFDREIFGLDFGYSQDPAALVQCRIVGDTLYCRELIYECGMTNQMLAKRMDSLGVRRGYDVIIADSAEPKSIEEIHQFGFDIRPSVKGPDSIRTGIQKVNQYKQVWTTDSLNCIKEQRNYQWERDKDGKYTNKPINDWNHGMDARRYATSTLPEPKILPSTVRVEPFKINWSKDAVRQKNCLHYGCMSMTEDMSLHILCGIWDDIECVLYIYHAERVPTPSPGLIVPALVQIMRLNEFHFKKFIGNDRMFSEERSMARVLNKEFPKYCFGQEVKIRQPKRYDPYGAIATSSQLIRTGRLVVHDSLPEFVSMIQRWQVEQGKIEVDGMMESLAMLISELDQAEVIRPAIVMGGYKKIREFNY